jgi:hypothetical protein
MPRLLRFRGKKEKKMLASITPCFPQFVKIIGLAKNYGKLINVNM